MKRITIKDIAKLTNVNPSTVSRALKDNHIISEKVRTRIKEVAEGLNFTLNNNAIYFKNKKTKVIALIIPEISPFFIPHLIQGVSSTLNQHDFRLSIYLSENSYKKESDCIKECLGNNVDGILISLCSETSDLNHLALAEKLEIPIVIIDKSVIHSNIPEILFNNYSDALRCAQYLKDNKYHNILGIFGSKEMYLTQERLKGFLDVFNDPSPDIIFASNSQEAAQKTKEIDLKRYDAFFCMSDEVLIGFLSSYTDIFGEATPFNIISFSDGHFPQYIYPKIKYLHHDGFTLGTKAAMKLLDIISGIKIELNTEYISSEIV